MLSMTYIGSFFFFFFFRRKGRSVAKSKNPESRRALRGKSGERRGTVPKRQRLLEIFCGKGEGHGVLYPQRRRMPPAPRAESSGNCSSAVESASQSTFSRQCRHFVCLCCVAMAQQLYLFPVTAGFFSNSEGTQHRVSRSQEELLQSQVS